MGQIDDINSMITNTQGVADAILIKAQSDIDGAFKQLAVNIDAYLTPAPPIVVPPAPSTDLSIPNAQEKMFDSMHVAYGCPVDANGVVTSIPDRLGKYNLTQNKNSNTTITGFGPQLIDNMWLMFENRPNSAYYGAMLDKKVPPPFEVIFITRYREGQAYETKSQNGSVGCYFGDSGSTLRLYGNYGSISTPRPQNYMTVIERYVMNPDRVDIWINNVLSGTYLINNPTAIGDIPYNGTKAQHAVGVSTNCMDHDWAATYFKAGLFSDADWATVYQSLAAKWGAGTSPDQILLSNIIWTNNNGTYTPSAKVMHIPAGVTVADPSTWDYEWFWMSAQTNFDVQTSFSKSRIITGGFPTNDVNHTAVSIKFRVRPKDSNGKSWRWFSGIFNPYQNGQSI